MPRIRHVKKQAYAAGPTRLQGVARRSAPPGLPTYSVHASPYVREFTKLISRLYTDAPTTVATEVLTFITATCKQYPLLVRRPSTQDEQQPETRDADILAVMMGPDHEQYETDDDGTMIETSDAGRGMEMEVEVEPVQPHDTDENDKGQMASISAAAHSSRTDDMGPELSVLTTDDIGIAGHSLRPDVDLTIPRSHVDGTGNTTILGQTDLGNNLGCPKHPRGDAETSSAYAEDIAQAAYKTPPSISNVGRNTYPAPSSPRSKCLASYAQSTVTSGEFAPIGPFSQHFDLVPNDTMYPSGPRAETPPSQPIQLNTPTQTPPGTPTQELAHLHTRLNVDSRYIRLGIPDIYHRAFDLLNNRKISVTKNNKRTQVTLTSQQAYNIVHVFFSEMFCTTHERIADIMCNVEAYNIACRADVARTDKCAPTAIQDVFESLSAIARRDTPATLDYLVQNIDNVRLRESWEKIRVSLAMVDKSSRQYIDYLELGTPTHGTTYVSLAKKAICKKAGISAGRFADYLRNAQVPAALARHFGLGGLLYCPNNISGNRHRFQYPSAAEEIFGIIKTADTQNLLNHWSKTLQQHIVQDVWDRSPLRLTIMRAAVSSDLFLLCRTYNNRGTSTIEEEEEGEEGPIDM